MAVTVRVINTVTVYHYYNITNHYNTRSIIIELLKISLEIVLFV